MPSGTCRRRHRGCQGGVHSAPMIGLLHSAGDVVAVFKQPGRGSLRLAAGSSRIFLGPLWPAVKVQTRPCSLFKPRREEFPLRTPWGSHGPCARTRSLLRPYTVLRVGILHLGNRSVSRPARSVQRVQILGGAVGDFFGTQIGASQPSHGRRTDGTLGAAMSTTR